MKYFLTLTSLWFACSTEYSEAFSIYRTTPNVVVVATVNHHHKNNYHYSLAVPTRLRHQQSSRFAKNRDSKSDDDDDGSSSGPGMEAAFRELENLKSLDGDNESTANTPPPSMMKKDQDEAFAKAMESLNLKDYVEPPPPVTPEKEVQVYQEMVSELEETSENEVYSDLLSDMGGSPDTKKTIPSLSELIPELNDPTSVQDTSKFMDQALEEALAEAKEKAGTINKESVLDNKEIMKEIEAIFDDANTKLLDGLEEIRMEQQELVRKSSQKSAQSTNDQMEKDQQRLVMAQANMEKMLAKVNKETKEVESAVEDLKKAQADMEADTMGQLVSLKSGGIVKQATLVGGLLFTIRSLGDALLLIGGDPSHLTPLVIQGAIALACIVAFLFL